MPNKVDKSQIEKFREAARALPTVTADDYDEAVAKIAKAPKLSDEEIKKMARDAKAQAKADKQRKAPATKTKHT